MLFVKLKLVLQVVPETMAHMRFLAMALVGQMIFIYGFLPMQIDNTKETEYQPLPNTINEIRVDPSILYEPKVDHLILMVIDAMRDDFVTGPEVVHQMPYLSSLIQSGEGVHFTSLVESPTVTLPRIKAITMGKIPNYADVILNLLEKESDGFKDDSIIRRATSKNLSKVFYGDDTWLRLFPKAFLRSEGTSSFFVSDFSEVDDNVTRHLDRELKQNDWDIMILHYLGLDHIGHIHGPYSDLIPSKLLEMDGVIEKLHRGLNKLGPSTLFVICGDHGMKDTGGHGGATYSETHVPLIFVSPSLKKMQSCHRDPENESGTVNQRDLASTLSVLLGLPPPSLNLGRAILCILQCFVPNAGALLYSLHVNSWQVASLLDVMDSSSKGGYLLFEEASKLHSNWITSRENSLKSDAHYSSQRELSSLVRVIAHKYSLSISKMTSKLAESLVNFDFYAMFLGILVTWQAFLAIVLGGYGSTIRRHWIHILVISLILIVFHMLVCSSYSCFISNLCRQDPFMLIPVILLALLISYSSCKIYYGLHSFGLSNLKEIWETIKSPVHFLLAFGSILHLVSLFSSSFIEEEHQTWQFLCISLIILLAMQSYSNTQIKLGGSGDAALPAPIKTSMGKKTKDAQVNQYTVHSSYEPYQCKSHGLNTEGEMHWPWEEEHRLNCGDVSDYEKSVDPLVDLLPIQPSRGVHFQRKQFLLFIVLLFIYRLLRDYNHTGDKWGDLPDIGDWISEPNNLIVRSVVMASSLVGLLFILIHYSLVKTSTFNGSLMILASLCMYGYRAAIGDVSAFNLQFSSRGIFEYRAFLILLTAGLVFGCYQAYSVFASCDGHNILNHSNEDDMKSKRSEAVRMTVFVIVLQEFSKFWIILLASLKRPGDVPIVVAFILSCRVLAHVHRRVNECAVDVHFISKIYIWLGMMFYFFEGNSNSLASIDLQAGYVGQDSYNPFIIGFLLFIHTFSMPIMALLILFESLAIAALEKRCFSPKCFQKAVNEVVKCVVITRLLPVIFYLPLMFLQRHHLFIWTVFAPKLLYEAFFTLASLFGLTLHVIIQVVFGVFMMLRIMIPNEQLNIKMSR